MSSVHSLKILEGNSSDTLYSQFLRSSLLSNTPAIIKNCGSIDWMIGMKIDQLGPVKGILSLFDADLKVPVDGVEEISRRYDASGRIELSLREFFNRSIVEKQKGLYVKDWHAFLHDDNRRAIYELFDIFVDDWLNWYYKISSRRDDYKFIYIGGEETCTALHHDVCCSYSWSVNLYGRKIWTLIPPSQARYLFPSGDTTNEHPDIDPRVGRYDPEKYPDLDPSTFIVVEQAVNEAIFIPSGWYHLVENMDISKGSTAAPMHNLTISINHNWFNAFSIFEVFQFLLRDLNAVRGEILHLRAANDEEDEDARTNKISKLCHQEWCAQCEVLLKANSSLGFIEFVGIISARALMYLLYVKSECYGSRDKEYEQHLRWRHYLCPWFDLNYINTMDSHDKRCLELLSTTEIQEDWVNVEEYDLNLLSYYMPASSSSLSRGIHHDIKYPIRALEFSILVIRNLLNIISNEFPDLVTHIDASSGLGTSSSSSSSCNDKSCNHIHQDVCVNIESDPLNLGYHCYNYRDAVFGMSRCVALFVT